MKESIVFDKSKGFALELLRYTSIFVMKRKNLYCQSNYCEAEQV